MMVRGTGGNDTLQGADTINGYGGDDLIVSLGQGGAMLWGGAGNDTLIGGNSYGGAGDTIDGGSGHDSMTSFATASLLLGGDGDDTIDGGYAATLSGGRGNDVLMSGGGGSLSGGSGNDTIEAASGDVIDGGTGFDVVRIGAIGSGGLRDLAVADDGSFSLSAIGTSLTGVEQIELTRTGEIARIGSASNDRIVLASGGLAYGGGGNDTLDARSSAWGVWLDGGSGADLLLGGAGDDTFVTGAYGDTIRGGAGTDIVNYDTNISANWVNIDLAAGGYATITFDGARDLLSGIEEIRFRDALIQIGSNGADALSGGTRMYGFDGDDSLVGAATGGASLSGGRGNDTLSGGSYYYGQPAGDTLDGGDGNDDVRGTTMVSVLIGGRGNDTLAGGGPSYVYEGSTLDGGDGNDLIRGGGTQSLLVGGNGNDTLVGSSVSTLTGESGADSLASGGSNSLSGGDGNDTILGSGTDTIDGGGGYDVLRLDGFDQSILYGLRVDDDGSFRLPATGAQVTGIEQVDLPWPGMSARIGASANDRLAISSYGAGYGAAGNDTLDARAAVSGVWLDGGSGTDLLLGGVGLDTITGHLDGDTIRGGAGYDVVDYGRLSMAGLSLSVASGGGATLAGLGAWGDPAPPWDSLSDIEEIRFGDATLALGSAGDDMLAGTDIYGFAGADTLTGTGAGLLDGGDGDDVLVGSGVGSTLAGGNGNDGLVLSNLADFVDGGSGWDTADVSRFTGWPSGGWTFYAQMRITYGSGQFTLSAYENGTSRSTTFSGVESLVVANWTTQGYPGLTLQVGTTGSARGRPLTDGFLAGDTVAENAAAGTVVGRIVPLAGPGTATFRLLDSSGGGFVLDQSGQLTVAQGAVLDYEAARSRNVTVRIADNWGAAVEKTFTVRIGNVSGLLEGTSANDSLSGTSEEDVIRGQAGADTLSGGLGNDTLSGGAGDDVFVFRKGTGSDLVTDFQAGRAGHDGLAVDTALFADWTDLLRGTRQVGSDLVLTAQGGDRLTLRSVLAADLTQETVRFVS